MDQTQLSQTCNRVVEKLQADFVEWNSDEAFRISKKLLEGEAPEVSGRVLRELFSAGPLVEALGNDEVTEILVNGCQDIWFEIHGKLERSQESFLSEYTLERYVRGLLAPLGRKLDRKTPVVDARLPDGARVCVIGSPAVLGGYHLAIRKFQRRWHRLDQLVESGFISPKAQELIRRFVKEKKNILISGATGTGKTTLLNALAGEVPDHERIITIEDTAELDLSHPHVVRLEGRPPNLEGEGEISLRTLVRAAMRLRPDRIYLGECRGAEALDVLQAFNTGHGGSMATIHANSPRDALYRLELLALLNSDSVANQAIKSFIQSAIQVVVHLEKREGRRLVHSVQELRGLEGGVYLLKNHEL